jgi:hypothetical protein
MADPRASPDTPPFLDALAARGPSLAPGGERGLYDGLIGSWDAEVVDHLPDGDLRQSAEVHFAWILEGRAVQDVWIVPARAARATGLTAERNRYGTTLRRYDPVLDAWRITWWNPPSGSEAHLVGRREGDRIVHEGSSSDGALLRWSFVTLDTHAFHWRGECSRDGGRTWRCESEYFARRRPEVAFVRRAGWRWIDRPGLESLTLALDRSGARAEGHALVVLDGQALEASYRVLHDASWAFRSAEIQLTRGSTHQRLTLERRADGSWLRNESPCPELGPCEDVDLQFSPYTNTPPLLAKPLAPNTGRTVRVAWVTAPELAIQVVGQEYKRLGPGTRYRYRNCSSGITGELVLGADDLVQSYGPWLRV